MTEPLSVNPNIKRVNCRAVTQLTVTSLEMKNTVNVLFLHGLIITWCDVVNRYFAVNDCAVGTYTVCALFHHVTYFYYPQEVANWVALKNLPLVFKLLAVT